MVASKVLGILSLCLGWLSPIVGLILGIIGLSIHKEKGKESRDKTLNIVGICLAVVSFIVWYALLASGDYYG
jgi:uncharacterized membrane protein